MKNSEGSGKDPKKPKDSGAGWQAFTSVSQLGFNMAVCVVGSFWLGNKLDGWFGTSPWMLIIMTLLGAAASFKILIDSATK